jgi:hypothetical protein
MISTGAICTDMVYVGSMGDAKRVLYDIDVMARLKHPLPDTDDPSYHDIKLDVDANRWQFANDAARDYSDALDRFDPDDGYGLPNPLLEELGSVSTEIAILEGYRDRLIVFARTLAAEPASARTVAACTGLSHSTIVRMVTEETIAAVAADVEPAIDAVLTSLDIREDPQFYLRLQQAARMAKEARR